MNIIILASGSGTNAEQLIKHFASHPEVTITGVLSNKPEAYVLERAKNHSVPTLVFNNEEFKEQSFMNKLNRFEADFIILAGFLRKIPDYLIKAFPDKIINIHPSLLPKYGGKGMYGSFVHEAVIANKEKESGITIHLVNEKYDDGRVLFQISCGIDANDTPDVLASKIHQLEHEYFPQIVEDYLTNTANY
ncbi:MAG: phosphoribosylglycinamide formyltransferase [Cyclobacteriaceae bacterium]